MRSIISASMVTLIIITTFTLAFNIQPAEAAGGTVFIRADGSIDPPTAPILTSDNVTYVFTADFINESIVVQRNSIVIDGNGHALKGPGLHMGMTGIDMSERDNVTVRNANIEPFDYGILLDFSFNNTISNNTIYACEGVWLSYSSNNIISGNSLKSGGGLESGNSVHLIYSSGNTIFNNTLRECFGCSISLEYSPSNMISRNDFLGAEWGISVYSSPDSVISENNVGGCATSAIGLSSSPNSIISANNVTGSHRGIGIYSSSVTVSKNIITGGMIGMSISGSSITASGNRITGSHESGIQSSTTNSILSGNEVIGSQWSGIYLESSSNNSIFGNNVTKSAYVGIVLTSGSSNNIFYHNNLIDNTQQVDSDGSPNTWDNGYPSGGNYWSDYNGVDADGDGIGDVSYVIDANNQDRYPLIHPCPLPVSNVNTGLDYPTIQDAINANETTNGNTIFIRAGTYYENICVNKTLRLIGENKETTIIDGSGGIVVALCASNIEITGFTIENGHSGIANSFDGQLWKSDNNSIRDNHIENCGTAGIWFSRSSDGNNISDNLIANNGFAGIYLTESDANLIWGNTIINHPYANILFYDSSNNTVSANMIAYSEAYGIGSFLSSGNNVMFDNVIANNEVGIYGGSNNRIYHNNFINNTQQAYIPSILGNTWDDNYPSGGNYWSDYVGADVKKGSNQDEPGSDDIGDTPYVINNDNRDRYPLMNPYGSPQPLTFALAITTTANGTTDPATGNYTYSQGQSVPLQAIPDTGYSLDHWQLDGNNVGKTNPITVTMDANHTLHAVFMLHDVAVTNVTLQKTTVGQGYSINLNVTVKDNGDYPESLNITLYAGTTAIATITRRTLLNGTSVTILFTWETAGSAKGNYTIWAYVEPVLGETNTADNTRIGGWAIVTIPGDVDRDKDVDIFDVVHMAGVYGVKLPDPRFDCNCDIDGDGDIDIFDIVIAAMNYGKSW